MSLRCLRKRLYDSQTQKMENGTWCQNSRRRTLVWNPWKLLSSNSRTIFTLICLNRHTKQFSKQCGKKLFTADIKGLTRFSDCRTMSCVWPCKTQHQHLIPSKVAAQDTGGIIHIWRTNTAGRVKSNTGIWSRLLL